MYKYNTIYPTLVYFFFFFFYYYYYYYYCRFSFGNDVMVNDTLEII